jgi:6-phosphogluconolactonase (cycloisomerase 2 family)
MQELRHLTNGLIERETMENCGQLYQMVSEKSGHLFETSYENGILCYLTKWAPNTQVLVQVADHLNLSYTHSYEEPGMMIYGRDTYKNGELVQIMLDNDDFALYQFNQQTEYYEFEGESYPSDEEILETLFRRKLTLFRTMGK